MGHPLFENRSRLIAWSLIWILLGAGQTLLFHKYYGGNIQISLTEGFLSIIVYSVLALAAWFPIKFFSNNIKSISLLTINLLAIMLTMTGLWLAINFLILSVLFSGTNDYMHIWSISIALRLWSGLLIAALVILSYYLIISFRTLDERKLDESRLENLLRETELRMLRSQINPHFLFNSLNSINALTISDPEKAREMVIRLSGFMRYALARKDDQLVPLSMELDNLRLYLDIEKTRFGDRLRIKEIISDDCLELRIPNMLLQPLYENAVKFGVHESPGSVLITTMVTCYGTHAVIKISNNYDITAIFRPGTGTGLKNVMRRLDLIYGKEASLTTAREDGLFHVEVKLPVIYQD